jgi:molecular chaperone GrpE
LLYAGEEELFPEDILGKNKKSETPLSQAEINQNAQIVSENATLLSRARENEDKYLRALAETENVRARLTKQIQDAKLFAVQGFCKDMTEVCLSQ